MLFAFNKRIALACIIGLILFALLLFYGNALLNDPDTYWHIGVGRWMLDHGIVPSADPFSNSIAGTRWVTHEWLAQVILAAVYQWLGWGGVILLTAAFAGISLAVFAYFVARWLEARHAILIVALGFLLLAPHMLARPHMLAMPIMIAFVGGLVVARERQDRPSLWLLPVLCLWANLHGSYIVGLAFAGYFALEAFLQAGRRSGLEWLLFAVLAFGSVLITPNGLDGVLIVKTYITDIPFMMSVIKEWQSPDFQHFQPVEAWLLGFIFVSLICGFRLSLTRLVILVGIVHLALKYSRNSELLGFLAPLVLLPALAPQFYNSRLVYARSGSEQVDDKFPVLLSAVLAVAIIMTAGSLAYFLSLPHHRKNDGISPIAAVEAARAAGVGGPVFNSYKFGGYLIYAGIPPFIDSRGELYGDKFFEQAFEAEASAKLTDLTELLTKYKIGWTLLAADSIGNLKLATLPDWKRLYADDFAVIYVLGGTDANRAKE